MQIASVYVRGIARPTGRGGGEGSGRRFEKTARFSFFSSFLPPSRYRPDPGFTLHACLAAVTERATRRPTLREKVNKISIWPLG